MGVFSRFERKLEHGVGSAFARMFKGKVHPAEIARGLQQDADDNATRLSTGKVLVPNRYVVRLGQTDYDHLVQWERQLTRSLADMCREHLASEGYATYGAVKVSFELDSALRTGVFEIESSVDDAEPSVPLNDYLPQRNAPPVRREPTEGVGPRPAPPMNAPRPPAPAAPPMPAAPMPATPRPASPMPAAPMPASMDDGSTQLLGSDQQRRTPPPPPSQPRYRHLVVVDGSGDRVALREGQNIIGRGSGADLRITDNGISREHIEILTNGALATLIDLQSTNGTMVNGKRASRAALRHGDVIRLGRTVLVYRYEPEGSR